MVSYYSNARPSQNFSCTPDSISKFRGGHTAACCPGRAGRANLAPAPQTASGQGRTELKITDGQSPQWNAFAEALRANARRMTEMHGMMGQGASQSAPERLDHMEKMMAAMLEAVRSTKAALTPLYAVLNDEQKKTADTLLQGPMGMMGPMWQQE